ncbi:MAG: hypothetical protein HUJ70_14860 [Pseudobutyrivibrio sp.]|nr:hypothetical protein [Pseudobutyrivibrio sp.]
MTPKRQRDVKPEYLRIKQAMVVFDLGADKIEQLAKECGALYKIDKCVLIKYEALRSYVESFLVV